MGITREGKADRGSQLWIQRYVNERSAELNAAISSAAAGALPEGLEWRSPLEGDGYAEYYDDDFVDQLGIELPARSLASFWPRGGPRWDALARSAGGDAILVEAKSHIPEIFSNPTGAAGESLERIEASLAETAEAVGASTSCDWSDTFYQYANRLAHLYLLRQLNDVPAWLVFVGFTGDREMKGPENGKEWEAAYAVVNVALGIRGSPLLKHVLHVHVPVF